MTDISSHMSVLRPVILAAGCQSPGKPGKTRQKRKDRRSDRSFSVWPAVGRPRFPKAGEERGGCLRRISVSSGDLQFLERALEDVLEGLGDIFRRLGGQGL